MGSAKQSQDRTYTTRIVSSRVTVYGQYCPFPATCGKRGSIAPSKLLINVDAPRGIVFQFLGEKNVHRVILL